jgi:predicted membrane channel-forming protein YqfA (hemolysin III family)
LIKVNGTICHNIDFLFLLCVLFLLFFDDLGVFVGLGLSGIIPTLHYVISEGFLKAATIGQIGWLMLMASLYITGAALYAARIPERFFPGKCDIWVSAVNGDK